MLFPAVSAELSPQLAAGIAATLTATVFEALAHRHFGRHAWLGALWFAAATATDLFTGRLAFAFGLLPAIASALALQRSRPRLACALALTTALCSPVAALFAALAGVASTIGAYAGGRRGRRLWPGLTVAVAALAPVGLLAIAFPEGGSEPFAFSTLWPVLGIALLMLPALGRDEWTLKAGIVLYALGCIASFELATPVGSNAARLGPLLAGPLAALLWWRRHPVWLLAAAAPLLYIQWQPPVRDVTRSAGDPSASLSYYQPLLSFLARQPGPPFRIEIPFTGFHWEAYQVAPRFPLARGWERQLDIEDNHLFYGARLTPASYYAWLRQLGVRFVAVSDVLNLDYSARRETALISRGLPYLRLAFSGQHWRVYAVRHATAIVSGVAVLRTLGPDSLTLRASRPGAAFVRVRFSPYWKLSSGAGCVTPAGGFTALTLRRTGPVRLRISFSLGRIGARAPRCS